jgi:murein DD-endopeptidase MepM/ murein hydrolase activator NlpD
MPPTTSVRDTALAERDALSASVAELEVRVAAMNRRNEEMIAELEYAVRNSFEPLEGLFKAADLDLDHVLATVRRDYSGTGGPRTPVSVSTRSYAGDGATIDRFDELLVDLDRMNMMRIAADRIPYTMPVAAAHRFTSAFGYRRDPKNGRRRMHAGIDLAAPQGTPIHATADGVVISAGAEGGYGQTVRIRHEFGFETLYAHNSRIRVKPGQRVSRGDHISDMGRTGRVTGVHLHYEVRLNGSPVNPMVYVDAARDVF